MNTNFKRWAVALLSLAALSSIALSCVQEEDSSLKLYYPEVSNIGPSMSFISGSPSYHGGTPSDFAIASVRLDGKAIECESFAINSESGVISISSTDNLEPGIYTLDITCKAEGKPYSFNSAFTVRMIKSTPEGLEVSTELLVIPFDEILTADTTLVVKTKGEHVSVSSWSLVQESGKEYFAINKEGVVRVNTNYGGEFMPGSYPISVKIVTYAGEQVYENISTIRLTSLPIGLTYTPGVGRMEADYAYSSPAPVLKGSAEGLKYELVKVTPSSNKISIDPATGVISVAAGNAFTVGSEYVCDVKVTNEYGNKEFSSVFTLNVIAYITPIEASKFSYPETETFQGSAFTVKKAAGFAGDEVTFSFGELPAALNGQISIDPLTGDVTAAKGNTIPLGTYTVPVKAENVKSSATANITLRIVDNPYYFTFIRYGNNIGLPTDGTHANQFRYANAADYTAARLTPQTDAKAGVELVWKVRAVHQCSGTAIDPATGEITPSGFKANNQGLVIVTATAGEGTTGETSVSVPVFFSFLQPLSNGATLEYNPFVMMANPRKGYVGSAPTVSGMDASLLLLDYRRTFNYYNYSGPDSHSTNGQLSASNYNNLLGTLWINYFDAVKKTRNFGSKDPISYYSNSANLGNAVFYVDATSKGIVVNANKAYDNDGVAANGFFSGQITYVLNGDSSGINNGSQIFPVWIWFDERF